MLVAAAQAGTAEYTDGAYDVTRDFTHKIPNIVFTALYESILMTSIILTRMIFCVILEKIYF